MMICFNIHRITHIYIYVLCVLSLIHFGNASASECLPVRLPGETSEEAISRHERMRRDSIEDESTAIRWASSGRNVFVGVIGEKSRVIYALALSSKSILDGIKAMVLGPRDDYFVATNVEENVVFVRDNGWQVDCSFQDRIQKLVPGRRYAFLVAALSGSADASYRIGVASESAIVSDSFVLP